MVVVFLAVRVYHCEQSEVRACSSVQSLTVTQINKTNKFDDDLFDYYTGLFISL